MPAARGESGLDESSSSQKNVLLSKNVSSVDLSSPLPRGGRLKWSRSRGQHSRSVVDSAADFEDYFVQFECLRSVRVNTKVLDAFHRAISSNADAHFYGKTVLVVGSSIGLLAIFAANAGARRVYAVEATHLAKHSETVFAHHGLEHVITVIQSTIEEADLPELVDVIVSDFAGNMLLGTSMIESVLYARNKFMKSGGIMYPSDASIYLAPLSAKLPAEVEDHVGQSKELLNEWNVFVDKAKDRFKVNFSALSMDYEKEIKGNFLRTSDQVHLSPCDLLGNLASAVCIKSINMLTSSLEDVRQIKHRFSMNISSKEGDMEELRRLSGFAGWVSINFNGSPTKPSRVKVDWSTSPFEREGERVEEEDGGAQDDEEDDVGQEAFSLHPSVTVTQDKTHIKGYVDMSRHPKNWRSYSVHIEYSLCDTENEVPTSKQHLRYQLMERL